jgi:hypothetical protein
MAEFSIKIITKNTSGELNSFNHKLGGKHKAASQTNYSFMVDGKEGLPPGTRIYKKGGSLLLEFSEKTGIEISDWDKAEKSTLTGLENARVLDEKTSTYVPAKEIESGSFTALSVTGEILGPLGEVKGAELLATTESSGFNPYYLAPLLLLALAGGGGGGGGGGDSTPEPVQNNVPASKINQISDYAEDNGAVTSAPTLTDYVDSGIKGITASNIAIINNVLATANVAATNVDTPQKLQAVVDAYLVILNEANGTPPDATATDPAAADFAAIGASVGTAATDVEALRLLIDVLGLKSQADVDTVAEINTLAALVNKVMAAAAGGAGLTAAEFTALGVTGVGANLANLQEAIALSTDDGMSVDQVVELQAMSNAATLKFDSQNKINAYAVSGTNPAPTVQDYVNVSVSGVAAANLGAVNSAVDAQTTAAPVDTAAELRLIVANYNTILAEANGATPDPTPGDPLVANYAILGVQLGCAATDQVALDFLNDVIGTKTAADVDTVAEINRWAVLTEKVYNAQHALTPTPSVADLVALGATGVTAANLVAVVAELRVAFTDQYFIDNLSSLQSVIDFVNAPPVVVAMPGYNMATPETALVASTDLYIAQTGGETLATSQLFEPSAQATELSPAQPSSHALYVVTDNSLLWSQESQVLI